MPLCVFRSPQALNFFDSQAPPAFRPSVTITYSTGSKNPPKGPVVKGAEADSEGSGSEEQQDTRAFGEDVYASEAPAVQEQSDSGW